MIEEVKANSSEVAVEENTFTINNDLELTMLTSVHPCPYCNGLVWFRKNVSVSGVKKTAIQASPTVSYSELDEADSVVLTEMCESGKATQAVNHLRQSLVTIKQGKEFEAFQRTKGFCCPYCNAEIQARVLVHVIDFVPVAVEEVASQPQPETTVTPRGSIQKGSEFQQKVYHLFQESGMLDIYLKAVQEQNPASCPKTPLAISKHIEAWFLCAVRLYRISAATTKKLTQDLRTPNLQFFTANKVVGVVADGYIKTFLTTAQAFDNESVSVEVSTRTGKIEEVWRKTPFGYVVGRGVFFEALMAESSASIGKATGKQRKTQSYSAKPEGEVAA